MFVLRQPATPVRVEPPEKVLRICLSLVGGELEEARGLAIVLTQPATTVRVSMPETLFAGAFP